MQTLEQIIDLVSAFASAHWLSLIGAILSLIWVSLEYRASMWLWPVGIILPLFYIAISWEASFIGNIAVNIYYFITSIIGWILWLRRRGGEERPITHIPRQYVLGALGAGIGLFLVWAYFLQGHSVAPLMDALSTSASFVGMVLLGRKYLEQWFCWMIANVAGAYVFAISGDWISVFVFVVNLGMSFAGYMHWRKLLKANA